MKTTKQKPSAVIRLYSAAQKYVDSRGGCALVATGAGFYAMTPNKFLVCVEMIGRPPVYSIPRKNVKK